MRTILIGDIHGCYREFVKLLEKIQFNKNEDKLILLGDYTDRGPNSYEVYVLIKELKEHMQDKCILIYGNHEKMISDCVQKHNMYYWQNNGIEKTIESFKKNKLDFKEYIDFINNNTVKYYVDKNFQVCHAGTYLNNLENESEEVLLWDRDCIRYAYYDGRLTIIGHTPINHPVNIIATGINNKPQVTEYKKENKEYMLPEYGLLAIDTGCCFDGDLTAMIINEQTMKFFKVRSEKGINK